MKMSGDKMLASSSMLMFLLSLLMASFFDTTAGQIGVCFGQMGNNLPNPREVVAMYQYYNIKRMRMYGNNTEALDALRGSGIEFILDVPNPYLKRFAESQSEAHAWVQNYVKNYSKDIIFRYISVGNEVKPGAEGRVLFQAMQNIDKAVSEAGLSHIKVSTTTYMGAFADTFPPSYGRFKDEFRSFLQPAIHFLAKKGSPLLVNIYTYFAYKDNKDKIPLEYALFTQTTGGNPDKQYIYRNLFDASLDSVYAALEKTGGGSMDIVVSESGWPTHGDEPEANVDNAKIYINNLIQHVKKGSPKKTGKPIETYIFAMFDEDLKGPQKYEKYWGLFFPTKQPKYEVEFD